MNRNAITEFGDFQTPLDLAKRICCLLKNKVPAPSTILEPTCGTGTFLEAASEVWPQTSLIGMDVNPTHVEVAKARLASKASVMEGDFFNFEWSQFLKKLSQPTLIIGNLPWVTNSKIGLIDGRNLPQKNNFQGQKGIAALTGKSNFDISEWMLIQMLHWLNKCETSFAILCKTSVARKILLYAWRRDICAKGSIYLIDAKKEFNVSVDACLLCFEASKQKNSECNVYSDLEAVHPQQIIGHRNGNLVADVKAYEQYYHFIGTSDFKWRSGIKHDCSKVMEFIREDGRLINGFGESVKLEMSYLFPMFKSSDIVKEKAIQPKRWMLVTQQNVNDPTNHIASDAPQTWKYLMKYAEVLQNRSSSIYRNRAPFSVFGVGEYSFMPWKVAISGFYRSLKFKLIGKFNDKPIVVDDTVNFIPCQTLETAEALLQTLNSEEARNFYRSFIFWDMKRPITVDILSKLNVVALAKHLDISIPHNHQKILPLAV